MKPEDDGELPKRLFVIADGADQCSHGGHAKLSELVIWTDEARMVGEYRLVRKAKYICKNIERVVKVKDSRHAHA